MDLLDSAIARVRELEKDRANDRGTMSDVLACLGELSGKLSVRDKALIDASKTTLEALMIDIPDPTT